MYDTNKNNGRRNEREREIEKGSKRHREIKERKEQR
jgi:hypothetical protein